MVISTGKKRYSTITYQKLGDIWHFDPRPPYTLNLQSDQDLFPYMYGVLQNSIRHNLSLHDKFKRIQNEGTGKSSWWTINYNAKPGKSPRRRVQSMDQSMASKASKGAKMAAKRKVGCLTKLETSSSYLLTSVLHLISITFYTIHQVFTPQHRGVLS